MPADPVVADLHLHSTASDGALSPEAVVDLAAAAGLRAMALTDHDTVAGVARAQARGRELGIEVWTGCEVTVYAGSIELHVLAYGFDASAESPLCRVLQELRAARSARATKIVAQLAAAGVKVDEARVRAIARDADSIGKPHVALALVEAGHARNVPEAFRLYLSRDGVGHVEKRPLDPTAALEAIHASGGIASLAHPGQPPHDEQLAPLFRIGLDAVEALHAAHGDVNRRFYAGLARRYDRGVSGGSDFHAPNLKPGLVVGCSGVSSAQLADLRRRIASRAAHAPAAVPA
ncbi:MAG: phosphatase [Planctomycetota bacterium]